MRALVDKSNPGRFPRASPYSNEPRPTWVLCVSWHQTTHGNRQATAPSALAPRDPPLQTWWRRTPRGSGLPCRPGRHSPARTNAKTQPCKKHRFLRRPLAETALIDLHDSRERLPVPIHKRLLAPLSIPSAGCPCSRVEPADYVLLGTRLSAGECKRCTMREVPEAHDRQVQLLPDAEQRIRVGDRDALPPVRRWVSLLEAVILVAPNPCRQ